MIAFAILIVLSRFFMKLSRIFLIDSDVFDLMMNEFLSVNRYFCDEQSNDWFVDLISNSDANELTFETVWIIDEINIDESIVFSFRVSVDKLIEKLLFCVFRVFIDVFDNKSLSWFDCIFLESINKVLSIRFSLCSILLRCFLCSFCVKSSNILQICLFCFDILNKLFVSVWHCYRNKKFFNYDLQEEKWHRSMTVNFKSFCFSKCFVNEI